MISSSQRPLPDNTRQSQQTSLPPAGFEPTISAGERPQTYALDRAAAGTRKMCCVNSQRKSQQDATMYENFIISYLYEAQHVSGDTPSIIRSLKLHWQPLVFHTWKVVTRVVGGRQVEYTLTTYTNSTSSNLPRMQNQRLSVQF